MHKHDNGTEPIVSAIKTPLSQASVYLSHYRSRIAAAWRRMLRHYEPCRPFLAALAGVRLGNRLKEASVVSARTYREEAERMGRDLARDGVPAGCIALAVTLYAEGCLRYLNAEDPRTVSWRSALARWASAYQFTLLSGYADYVAEHTQILEERTALAERRSKDLLVEMGDAYEKERRKLAQDLHDEIGHDLIVLKLYTQVIESDLKKGDIGALRGKLRESLSLINHALKGIRHLVFDLGPAVWNEQGFIPAVRLYTRQFATRTGLRTRFSARRLTAKLPGHYETTMYRVLQGALANVAAHAGARNVKIALASRRDSVVMKIEDDGKGFDVGRTLKRPPRSYGLRAMRDRIELLGGTIQFISRAGRRDVARGGTLVEIHLPLRTKSRHHEKPNHKVLLCDDHTLFRDGIKEILKDHASINIVAEASNGREAVEITERLRPDVALLDVAMPDMNGFEATSRIVRISPRTKVVILTMYEEEEVITRCLKAGASGYVLKDASRSDLIHAIETAKGGGQYLSPRALKKVVKEHVKHSGASTSSYDRLSARERRSPQTSCRRHGPQRDRRSPRTKRQDRRCPQDQHDA